MMCEIWRICLIYDAKLLVYFDQIKVAWQSKFFVKYDRRINFFVAGDTVLII